jgi:hypothetical protein
MTQPVKSLPSKGAYNSERLRILLQYVDGSKIALDNEGSVSSSAFSGQLSSAQLLRIERIIEAELPRINKQR